MDRGTLDQLRHLLRPLATRIANIAARATVSRASDGKKLQLLQLGVLDGETVEDAEHHQPYGFSSVPMGGAEAVVIFPGGDRAHPLVVAVSDRRYRPTGGEAGEVTVYNHTGAKIKITKDGDIEVTPATGREVFVRDAGGTAQKLLTQADGLVLRAAINTATVAVGAGGSAPIIVAADLAVVTATGDPMATWPVGTKTLKGE